MKTHDECIIQNQNIVCVDDEIKSLLDGIFGIISLPYSIEISPYGTMEYPKGYEIIIPLDHESEAIAIIDKLNPFFKKYAIKKPTDWPKPQGWMLVYNTYNLR